MAQGENKGNVSVARLGIIFLEVEEAGFGLLLPSSADAQGQDIEAAS